MGLAPIFDTGTSLFHDISLYDLKNGFADIPNNAKSKPFAKIHTEQIKKLPCSKYCSDLPFENLNNISEYTKELFEQNRHIAEKIPYIMNIIQNRVSNTEQIIKHP